MSKIRVNELETLDGLNTKDVASLVDDINTAQVTTSTGEQTLVEALDGRVIFKSTMADLDELPSSALSDGQEASVLGTPFVWDAAGEGWIARGPINVKMYGAVGDGSTDDGAAVRTAIEALREGDTLFFPPGDYYTEYSGHSVFANWIPINKNGVTLRAAPGTVTLENFLFAAHGSIGTPVNVGESGFTTGDDIINTEGGHGFSAGDIVQLLSQRNSHTADGGSFQLGSRSPTSNGLPERRFSEIHVVQEVIDSTNFRIAGTVLYPNYANNTTGLVSPMSGVDSAQVRKINAIKDILFYGLTFRNIGTNSFREFDVSCVYGITWEKCGFVSEERPGRHVRTQNTRKIRFKECWERRSPENVTGSGWNSFLIASGSHDAFFFDCNFKGGHQTIDWTPAQSASGPSHIEEDLDGLTVQIIGAHNCTFEDCSDAATSHPGTYILLFHNNICINVRVGIRSRSLNASIVGNNIQASAIGVALSGFYHDTIIGGNIVKAAKSERFGTPAGGWSGVDISPMSSEIMNNNNVDGVSIISNSFSSLDFGSTDRGVQIRHAGNGVPPSENFTLFTDTIKSNLSRYVIMGNVFTGCGVRVFRFVNGVRCIKNTFDQCGELSAYFESDNDSARHRIGGNILDGGQPTNSMVTRAPLDLNYGYSTTHRVSGNLYSIGTANNSLEDSAPFNSD